MPKRSRNKIQDAEKVIPGLPAWLDSDWVRGLLLVFAVVLAYQPVWHAGFIWDDDVNITENPCIVGPLGLKEIWTTGAAWYYPLVSTTFWFEHALWGLSPLPYHLVNVFLLGASAVVLWKILQTLRVPGAWLGAALWALHPVQVESVAWATELKNTQSGLFYLLAILLFVKGLNASDHEVRKISRKDALVLLFAVLALVSKSSTVVLPLVLGLCAWWMEGRVRWRSVMRLAPIFVLSAMAATATIWMVHLNAGDDHSQAARSLAQRLATSGDVFWFYLGKLFWPSPIMFIYPRWQIDPAQWTAWLPFVAAAAVMTVLWIYRKSWGRPYFFALSYFGIALLPVLGFADQYFWRYSFVGDHFQYLAGIGPLALAAAAAVKVSEMFVAAKPWPSLGLGVVLCLFLGILTWRQAWVYESEETLWTDTLNKNPGCALARNNLGNIFVRQGHVDDAMALFRAGLVLDPKDSDLLSSLGNAFLKKGDWDAAADQFQKAVEIDPANFGAYNNLGTAYAQKGQVNEAIVQYEQALQIHPHYADAHNNLGNLLLQNGETTEALEQFHKALEINPNDVDALNNLGWALLRQGKTDEAIDELHHALAIDPANVKALNNLGIALAQGGHLDEAVIQFEKVLQLMPGDANAQNNLARAKALFRQQNP